MSDSWKHMGISSSIHGTTRHDVLDGVHRVTLEEVFEVATSERHARERLADRLEKVAIELRTRRT